MVASSNFHFLSAHDVQLAQLGALAERYFNDDAPAALLKLRQLAEFLAKEVAARRALLPSAQAGPQGKGSGMTGVEQRTTCHVSMCCNH